MANSPLIITARERDLGGFSVRRILPYATHKMVGPFIFFDHMGPAEFKPGQEGINVRPHPHIHLATVTYLFSGAIMHRDSLGSVQLIEPGAINLMIAGHGIVHSERTPPNLRETGSKIEGIQCWIALPQDQQDILPSFKHYSAEVLPTFSLDQVNLTLLMGSAFDYQSPVETLSDLFYLTGDFPKDSRLVFPTEKRECAVYVVKGKAIVNDQLLEPCAMAVIDENDNAMITALEDSQIMLLGGKSVGSRYIYWNFVSSSKEQIEQAKQDWLPGPGDAASRFPKIPSDHEDYIPLPADAIANPKGTIM